MDGNPSGLLLFSVISDYLVLELAYSSNTKAPPAQHIIDRMLNINMNDIFDSFFE